MDARLLDMLVDPDTLTPLLLQPPSSANQPGATIKLISASGRTYPIIAGIPRFVDDVGADQRTVADSFDFKWRRTGSYGSAGMRRESRDWMLQRYGFGHADEMRGWLESRGRIVDIGCGSGYSTSLWMDSWAGDLYVGVDISNAAELAQERLGAFPGTAFIQADALNLLFSDGTFNAAIAEGVFHHTPSTRTAIRSAARVLSSGGELLFYVYARKSPIREFTDDHVRAALAPMTADEAWTALEPLTRLGQILAELKATVDVHEDVPILGIPAGRYDIQRLLYWHFAKMFWNAAYTFEENVHVNFDWYRPRYAHRQSEGEVRAWCDEAGINITHFDVDPAGYTVRGVKR
jgi:ubiquinone/menaquinone biosynthesis C-methylase UbiE/uncharacterized protein YbaR (Trm112 family)